MNTKDLKVFIELTEQVLAYNSIVELSKELFNEVLEVPSRFKKIILEAKTLEIGAVIDGKVSIANDDFIVWQEGMNSNGVKGYLRDFAEYNRDKLNKIVEKIEKKQKEEFKETLIITIGKVTDLLDYGIKLAKQGAGVGYILDTLYISLKPLLQDKTLDSVLVNLTAELLLSLISLKDLTNEDLIKILESNANTLKRFKNEC